MAGEFCSEHSAHKLAIDTCTSRLNSHSHDLDANKESIIKLVEIEKQNAQMISQLNIRIDDIDRRLTEIEQQPARDAKRMRDAAIGAIGGVLGTCFISGIILALSNTM